MASHFLSRLVFSSPDSVLGEYKCRKSVVHLSLLPDSELQKWQTVFRTDNVTETSVIMTDFCRLWIINGNSLRIPLMENVWQIPWCNEGTR